MYTIHCQTVFRLNHGMHRLSVTAAKIKYYGQIHPNFIGSLILMEKFGK